MDKIYLKNEQETGEAGYRLGQLLNKGDIVCLIGDLGAGKTTITKSIAKALEVEDYITSPTFTIVNEYDGKYPLYHFDVYRISSSEDMHEIGFEEYLYGDGICIIEWANLIEDVLPDEYINIELNYKGEGREMIVTAHGEHYENMVKEIIK